MRSPPAIGDAVRTEAATAIAPIAALMTSTTTSVHHALTPVSAMPAMRGISYTSNAASSRRLIDAPT
jgi:hypothetical protein